MIICTRRLLLIKSAAACVAAVSIPSSTALAQKGQTQPRKHHVDIRKFAFSPQVLTVAPGDTIIWTNNDVVPHTATALDGSWDTGSISKRGSKSVLVKPDMHLAYFCRFHPMMKAQIEIEPR